MPRLCIDEACLRAVEVCAAPPGPAGSDMQGGARQTGASGALDGKLTDVDVLALQVFHSQVEFDFRVIGNPPDPSPPADFRARKPRQQARPTGLDGKQQSCFQIAIEQDGRARGSQAELFEVGLSWPELEAAGARDGFAPQGAVQPADLQLKTPGRGCLREADIGIQDGGPVWPQGRQAHARHRQIGLPAQPCPPIQHNLAIHGAAEELAVGERQARAAGVAGAGEAELGWRILPGLNIELAIEQPVFGYAHELQPT